MKMFQYYNAPEHLIQRSVSRNGHALNLKTVWRQSTELPDLVWIAQHVDFITHRQIIQGLYNCTLKCEQLLSEQSRRPCKQALTGLKNWLNYKTPDVELLRLSKAVGPYADTDFDNSEKDAYDADLYSKAYASISVASVTYAAVRPYDKKRDNIQIAAADLQCCQEYTEIELYLLSAFKCAININQVRWADWQYQEYQQNTK